MKSEGSLSLRSLRPIEGSKGPYPTNKKTLVVIAGPTASGKTSFSIELAKALNTVILSADSRQFYKEMSIGTAAPTEEELSQVMHYFVHHISIEDKYDVADYERDVLRLLNELFKAHDTVVMTGGSGLFIDAVCNGIDVMPDVDPEIREKVQRLYDECGLKALQDEVQRLDPEYYATVDQQNPRRLQRALEVCYQTGQPFSSFRSGNSVHRDFDIKKYALLWDRQALIERIDKRVDMMMEQGLLAEAKALYPKRHLNALNTVGYKELFAYFDGQCTLEEAVEQIKIHTRQYAKRQMTWLRKDKSYTWIMPDEMMTSLLSEKNSIASADT
ncbi:MAG: tRNA (adenosine(37)-N6)-dimethylallyltransferase MiaA [Bacteroidales bacterium]|nr:tRNA (adenosine(37)-N6)-dimethylallyltransferase MiaA [Bacteroidales bacterium]